MVADSMFRKTGWDKVPDSEKEACFFIFNRYFSKRYPDKSQLLNLKIIDKVSAMNIWNSFMSDKPYPSWFWGKVEKDKPKIPKKDFDLLLRKLLLKPSDIEYLIDNHFDFIKEELKYLNSLEKQLNK